MSEPYCRSMLDRPSDEDVSRQILGVFMRHRIPATGMLQRNYFFEVRDSDFQRGINKAVANNWVTIDLRDTVETLADKGKGLVIVRRRHDQPRRRMGVTTAGGGSTMRAISVASSSNA